MINQILDNRYEILERVGGGGMAEVYRAHDRLLDRYVAVKVLHTQFANDEEFVTKFRREAQGAAKLSHPNIVNIYDVGEEENKHYIIMEYVSGETLKDRILREGALPVGEALRIAREIAEALEHAHQNNLVHCDIKPHNILVTNNGRVKVTDFGIARAVTATTMTYSGTVIGSVHYFSPEQAQGTTVSAKSDIYSLGVVLYEMLTGALPFQGETPVSIALKHIQEAAPGVRQADPSIPPIAEAVVAKAMAKNPDDRFVDIAHMILDLKSAEEYISGDQTRKLGGDEFSTQILPKVTVPGVVQDEQNRVLKRAIQKPKSSRRWIIGFTVILLAGFFIGAFLSYGKWWSMNEVNVPNVVGKQLATAKATLEAENLRVSIAETFDENTPAGQVVSQYPEAGAVVKEQRLVTIYISKGGEAMSAPDLMGLSRRDAELKLKNAGLKLGRVDEQNSSEPADKVLGQNPRAGTQVIKGYAIDITVSKGAAAKKLTLPNFKGATVSAATAQLENLKLKVGKTTEVEDDKNPPGTIVSQSPDAGTEVLEDTTVDFTVAKEGGKSSAKRSDIELTIPEGPSKQAVQIIVTDSNGRRVIYENVHKPGDRVVKAVSGSGDLRIQVYVNGKLAQEKNL